MTTDTTPAIGPPEPQSIYQLDLSPAGLADAPAHQEDLESLVYPGNS
jgi:hypothetical protein